MRYPSLSVKAGLLRLMNNQNGAIIRLHFINHQVPGKEKAQLMIVGLKASLRAFYALQILPPYILESLWEPTHNCQNPEMSTFIYLNTVGGKIKGWHFLLPYAKQIRSFSSRFINQLIFFD
jgi:hypothetical protein